jgi:hypothetical protein
VKAGSVPSPEPQNTQMLVEDVESIENEDEEDAIVVWCELLNLIRIEIHSESD